ncbi:hypothetical protein SprV_0702456000 [Sparganum proliferum]
MKPMVEEAKTELSPIYFSIFPPILLLPLILFAAARLVRQSAEQPTETEDGASGPGTAAIQGGHRRTQRDSILKQGQLEEVGAGYTFFWSGRPRSERRDAGVAFAIRKDIVRRLHRASPTVK